MSTITGKPSAEVARLLCERIGLDAASVGENLIVRGVHARMSTLNLRSFEEYERLLTTSDPEIQALIEEVVVPETWFFRDQTPFSVLERLAQRGWVAQPGRAPLRVLSLPCASGEEPYSIAMTLLEAGLPARRFQVEGVDISARSLARAHAGVYSTNAFRGLAATHHRSRYFKEQGGSYTLDLAVRSAVRFHQGNILDASLLKDRAPFDIVFCRNLLIYLDDEAHRQAFVNLTRLMADGGVLFLGHADRLGTLELDQFELLNEKGAFAYRKRSIDSASPRTLWTPAPSPSVPTRSPAAPRSTPAPASAARGPVRPVLSAPVTLPPVPRLDPSRSDASLLDQAAELADQGRYEAALPLIEQAIHDGQATARAYFLLGMVAQASGDRQAAEAHYHKAVYLDPQHEEALEALSILARRRGDVAAEAGYRRRVERVRSRKAVS